MDTETHGGNDHVKIKAEIRVILPAPTRSWKRQRRILLKEPQRKHDPANTLNLDFWLPEL